MYAYIDESGDTGVYNKKTKDMYVNSLYKMLTILESMDVNNIYIASYISNKVFIKNLNEKFPNLEIKVTPASNNKKYYTDKTKPLDN